MACTLAHWLAIWEAPSFTVHIVTRTLCSIQYFVNFLEDAIPSWHIPPYPVYMYSLWSMCWNFMAFLYWNLLYLPDPQPRVLVVTCRRSYESVQEVGKNIAIVWRPDSSVLAVTVSFSALVYALYTVL